MACWFLLNKKSVGFEPNKFSINVFIWSSKENYLSEHFVEDEKDVNHLVQVLVNMVDGVE